VATYVAASLDRKEICRRALRAAFGLPVALEGPGPERSAAAPIAEGTQGNRKRVAAKKVAKGSKSKPAGTPAAGPTPSPDRPLLGVVSRLVDQKGIDVLLAAAPALIRAGADLIVLGAGDQKIADGLERLRIEHPQHVGLFIGFNEPLSHQVVAGSDLLLIPSRYEPCGLVQMHAMRYGTIPVVHRTGGLADTVRDADEHPGRGTGFVFDRIDPGSLAHAAHRGMTFRSTNAEAWRDLQRRAMAENFSWDRAAAAYEDLFAGITSS
jgi:starch synthase